MGPRRIFVAVLASLITASATVASPRPHPSTASGAPGRPRGAMVILTSGPGVQPDELLRLDRCPARSCTLDLDDRTCLHVRLTLRF